MEKTEDKRINLIMDEAVLDKTIHVDVTLFVSLGGNQPKSARDDGRSEVRTKVYNKKVKKYDEYHAEAVRRKRYPPPVIADSNGSFTDTDRVCYRTQPAGGDLYRH